MTTSQQADASALILDGGRATRLGGRHKSFLTVDGRAIAARLLEACRRVAGDVVVATSRPAAWKDLSVRTVGDEVAEAGPLAGIAAGLAAARRPLVVVLAGDMPHVSAEVLAFLLDRARAAPGHAVVPRRDGRAEPLHAVYPASFAPMARDALGEGVRRLTDFLARVPVAWVEADELAGLTGADRTFADIDAPEDLQD